MLPELPVPPLSMMDGTPRELAPEPDVFGTELRVVPIGLSGLEFRSPGVKVGTSVPTEPDGAPWKLPPGEGEVALLPPKDEDGALLPVLGMLPFAVPLPGAVVEAPPVPPVLAPPVCAFAATGAIIRAAAIAAA